MCNSHLVKPCLLVQGNEEYSSYFVHKFTLVKRTFFFHLAEYYAILIFQDQYICSKPHTLTDKWDKNIR